MEIKFSINLKYKRNKDLKYQSFKELDNNLKINIEILHHNLSMDLVSIWDLLNIVIEMEIKFKISQKLKKIKDLKYLSFKELDNNLKTNIEI